LARIPVSVLLFITETRMAVSPSSGTLGTRRHHRETAPDLHLGQFCHREAGSQGSDILLIMDDDSEVDRVAAPAQVVFDSMRAKLLFESDVFWARASIGREVLDLWLDTYQTSRTFKKRGIVELELP
jgi:hypothetical protein